MRTGRLRHRVTIQKKPPVTQNSFGEETPTWANVATVWAQVETLSGREFVQQGQAQVEITHKINVRYRDDLVETMRVVWTGRTFQIEAILADNVGRQMMLMCRENKG